MGFFGLFKLRQPSFGQTQQWCVMQPLQTPKTPSYNHSDQLEQRYFTLKSYQVVVQSLSVFSCIYLLFSYIYFYLCIYSSVISYFLLSCVKCTYLLLCPHYNTLHSKNLSKKTVRGDCTDFVLIPSFPMSVFGAQELLV